MGGSAFAAAAPMEGDHQVALQTPRMSPDNYIKLRNIYTARLSEYFTQGKVAHLKEAPSKRDYGDIDFMVAVDGFSNFPHMALATGASAYIVHGPGKCSLAVKQNGEWSDSAPVRYRVSQGAQTPSDQDLGRELFAQIDIEIIDPALHEWRTWHSSYGDMSGILGNIVRDLGFTLTTSGLWLRMNELNDAKCTAYHKIPVSQRRLLLSTDPTMVMQFLGLDVPAYERGFSTREDLFRWLGSCRMLLPDVLMQKRDISRDRQKAKKRGVFTEFFEEWLPDHDPAFLKAATPTYEEHVDPDGNIADAMSLKESINHVDEDTERAKSILEQAREHYLQESLDYFDVRNSYKKQYATLNRNINNITAVFLLKPIIAEQSGRSEKSQGEIMKAMRRWVGFKDRAPVILDQAHTDAECQLFQFLDGAGTSFERPDEVVEFVKQNWEDVRHREKARVKVDMSDV